MKVGSIARIRPDDDKYDNLRVRILAIDEVIFTIEILSGPLKGTTERCWDHYHFEEISALEQLAEVSE